MKKVAIITDSSAYLPEQITDELGIHVVPLTLHWGEETFRDGEDIRAEEFYARLVESDTIPTTSQTTVGEFERLFKSLLDQDYAVLAILLSSGISGTVESALQAQMAFPEAPLAVMDSQLVSMALGFMVLAVARLPKPVPALRNARCWLRRSTPKSASILLLTPSNTSIKTVGSTPPSE
jgi:DegV family protein with EDD domain